MLVVCLIHICLLQFWLMFVDAMLLMFLELLFVDVSIDLGKTTLPIFQDWMSARPPPLMGISINISLLGSNKTTWCPKLKTIAW